MSHTHPMLAVSLLFSLNILPAEAALTVGISGGENVVYSSISNVTWTGDANLLGTLESSLGYEVLINAIIAASPIIYDTANAWDTPANSGYHTISSSDFLSAGRVSWFGAKAFVTYLNSIKYADSNQWSLPSAGNDPQRAYNQTSSPLGELFYNELGGKATKVIPNTSYFDNVQNSAYWTGTEFASDPRAAWNFYTHDGIQEYGNKLPHLYAWAITPGNLTAVPLPGAVWLFGTGLVGLLVLRRRGDIG